MVEAEGSQFYLNFSIVVKNPLPSSKSLLFAVASTNAAVLS